MKELNVCFVGVGSIAKRHIRNLKKVCEKRNIYLRIDALRHGDYDTKETERLGICNVYKDCSEMKKVYDVVFITNPTALHLETLEKLSRFGRHFFIEKPICSLGQLKRACALDLTKNAVYYVACPLRYNAVIQYIKKNVKAEDILCVRSISSSYLPDWRPGTDYRNTYSAHTSMGGGVSIDLIHEWDYITWLLGEPKEVNYMSGKISELEIDSEDFAVYTAGYGDKIVELHLDYFGRRTIREILVFTKEETILGDIADNKIMFLNSGKHMDFREERDDYQIRELEHFLDMTEGNAENDSSIAHGIKVLQLTQGVCN